MYELEHYADGKYMFDLVRERARSIEENRYTVIIGENGSGKSQLLRHMALSGASTSGGIDSIRGAFGDPPAQLLAISNLVADVFPLGSKKHRKQEKYEYLGLRQATNTVSTGALRDSTTQFIAECLATGREAMLSPVLDLLGFRGCRIEFATARPSRSQRESLSLKGSDQSWGIPVDLQQTLYRDLEHFRHEVASDDHYGTVTMGHLKNLAEIAYKHEIGILDLLKYLKRSGMIDTSAEVLVSGTWVPVSRLSTGQLLLLSTVARLAATIKPNSLVLIDEPETGLHPTWQSAYIPLLRQVLGDFGSHFFIATHSPHIVSDATEVLVPGAEWGSFAPFLEPFEGRPVENLLYRVFGAHVSGNTMVNEDLTRLLAYISGVDAGLAAPDASLIVQRLKRLANSDTAQLNDLLDQATKQIERHR